MPENDERRGKPEWARHGVQALRWFTAQVIWPLVLGIAVALLTALLLRHL